MKCPFCGKEYSLLSTLIRHVKRHSFSECPVCGIKVKNVAMHCVHLASRCKHHAIIGALFSRKLATQYYDLVVEALENGYEIPKHVVRRIPRSKKVYVEYDNTIIICCEKNYLLVLRRDEIESLQFKTKRQLIERLERMGYKIFSNYSGVIFRAVLDCKERWSREV